MWNPIKYIKDALTNWINAHIKPFRAGVYLSIPFCGVILFSDAATFLGEFAVRLGMAAMVAFVSGMFTSLGTDFVKDFKQKRKKKRDAKAKKELEENKRKERAA